MKKYSLLLILGLILVISVSGCVEMEGFKWMGTGEVKEAPSDILQIQNVVVIPNPPIPAGPRSTFTLSFQVSNIDKLKEAKNVVVESYDYGRCKPKGTLRQTFPTIYPEGGARFIEWNFDAPTNSELGNMAGKCIIRFKASYDFDAQTVASLTAVSLGRLRHASQAGETVSVTPTVTKSGGPVKIDIEFDKMQPVRAGSIVSILIRIENKGSGEILNINKNDITIEPTQGLTLQGCSYPVDKNNEIPLIQKKSPPIRCQVKIPDIEEMKTYYITVKIPKYTYTLYEEKVVDIEPTFQGLGSGGGTGNVKEPPREEKCTENAEKCSSDSTAIEQCQNGKWVKKTSCPEGYRCEFALGAARCKAGFVTPCTEGAKRCSSTDPDLLETCVNGKWKGTPCAYGCENGVCKTKPAEQNPSVSCPDPVCVVLSGEGWKYNASWSGAGCSGTGCYPVDAEHTPTSGYVSGCKYSSSVMCTGDKYTGECENGQCVYR